MPHYRSLDTQIRLAIWDPDRTIAASGGHDGFKGRGVEGRLAEIARRNRATPHTTGPAVGFLVQQLDETEFEEYKSLQYLGAGRDFPFLLRIAGSELFNALSPGPAPRTNTKRIFVTEPDLDSSLSSVDSSRFECSISSDLLAKLAAIQEPNTSTTRRGFIENPLTSPKPLQVIIDLSNQSFAKEAFAKDRQELCIDIFFNGELVCSRIIKRDKVFSSGTIADAQRYQHYSGRRVDSLLEKPFIILPADQTADGSARDSNTATISFESRWNTVSELLCHEAAKWGKYGSSLTPVGQYLKSLSKLAFPQSAKGLEGGAAHRVGIIDVVIALGKTTSTNAAGLREPKRKLHEDRCGLEQKLVVVPEGPRPTQRLAQRDGFNTETTQRVPLGLRRAHTIAQIACMTPSVTTFGNTGIHLGTTQSPPKSLAQIPQRLDLDNQHSFKLNSTITMPRIGSSSPIRFSKEKLSTTQVAALVQPRREYPKPRKDCPQKTFKGVIHPDEPIHMTRSKGGPSDPATESNRTLANRRIAKASTQQVENNAHQANSYLEIQPRNRGINFLEQSSERNTPDVNSFSGVPSIPTRGHRMDSAVTSQRSILGRNLKTTDSTSTMTGMRMEPKIHIKPLQSETSTGKQNGELAKFDEPSDSQVARLIAEQRESEILSPTNPPPHATKFTSGQIAFRTKAKSYTAVVDLSKLVDTMSGLAVPFEHDHQNPPVAQTNQAESQHVVLRSRKAIAAPTPGGNRSERTVQHKRAKIAGELTLREDVVRSAIDDNQAQIAAEAISESTRLLGGVGQGKRNVAQELVGEPQQKRQRATGHSMSSRELNSLFDPHDKKKEVDDSLGSSYKEEARSSRVSSAKPSRHPSPRPRSLSEMKGSYEDGYLVALVKSELKDQPSEQPALNSVSNKDHVIASRPRGRTFGQTPRGQKMPSTKDGSFAIPLKRTSTYRTPSRQPTGSRRSSVSTISSSSSSGLESLMRNPNYQTSMVDASISADDTPITVTTTRTPTPSIVAQQARPDSKSKAVGSKTSSLRSASTATAGSPSKPRVNPHVSLSTRKWHPNSLCEDSVLTYADTALWEDVFMDPASGVAVRKTSAEREGVFRATEILFGSRFVVGL